MVPRRSKARHDRNLPWLQVVGLKRFFPVLFHLSCTGEEAFQGVVSVLNPLSQTAGEGKEEIVSLVAMDGQPVLVELALDRKRRLQLLRYQGLAPGIAVAGGESYALDLVN